MKLSQFKFKLPEEKIALHPAKFRDESRLMVVHKKTGEIEHRMFKDILEYFDKTLVIDEIDLLECELPVIKILVVCSKGTYIRALARI